MTRLDWKRCPRCEETKQRSEFHKSGRSRDGMAGYCKACSAAASKARYDTNPDHCRGVSSRWKSEGAIRQRLSRSDFDSDDAYRRALVYAQNRRDVERARRHVRAIKDNPCVDCGGWFHFSAMDFDHVRGSKDGNVSELVARGRSLRLIDREIAKCDLVCSNCHRVRTWTRNQEPEGVVADVAS